MIVALLSSLAFASPPAHVNLDEIEPWAHATDALLDGPPGCYEVVAHAKWAWDLNRLGSNRGEAMLVGRLHDGEWSGLRAISLGEVHRERRDPTQHRYRDELRVRPLLGRVEGPRRGDRAAGDEDGDDPTGSDEAVNLIREALDEVSGEVEVAWATWEPRADAVIFRREMPIGAGSSPPTAQVLVRFPQGGTSPDALEIDFPEVWHTSSTPRARVTASDLKVRAQLISGVAFPRSEALRAEFSVLGIRFSGAQTIDYRSITPCPEPARRDRGPAVVTPDDGV